MRIKHGSMALILIQVVMLSSIISAFLTTPLASVTEVNLATSFVADSEARWNFDRPEDWGELTYVANPSGELVIGVSDTQPNSYAELVKLVTEYGGRLLDTISMGGRVRAVVVNIPLDAVSSFVVDARSACLSRYIEPNLEFQPLFVPSDPLWTQQWGPQMIGADYAWNITTGDPEILVAVVDSGIDYNHTDLDDNYVALGYDWVNNDTDPMDDYGHGTLCAGIIAAELNNGEGVAGLAQVRIMAEKSGYPTWLESNLAKGIVHAVDKGAHIVSLSWGGYGDSELIHEAVRYAYNNGTLVIAAAGNDDWSLKMYPAAYDEVIAVTATQKWDKIDKPAWFTNFGEWVEVAAPGRDILSTVSHLDTSHEYPYDYETGTSMACPHVAGVAALIWSKFPSMTRDQVRAQLRRTANDLDPPGFDEYSGYGRINAKNAVEQDLPDHDLLVLCWNKPLIWKPNEQALINTTVHNFGKSRESRINVKLLVNGTVVDSKRITRLDSGASTIVVCSWTPTIEGMYNVTCYVGPVPNEANKANNVASEWVLVRVEKVIKVPQDYSTIQKAIDRALPGYTVQVASGLYYEHLAIDKPLTLMGETKTTTIIDCSYEIAPGLRVRGDDDVIRVVGWTSDITISGFTIRMGEYGVWLMPYASGNTISGNIISGCSDGVVLDMYTSGHAILSNMVTGNSENGILFDGSGHHISDNTVTRNTYGVSLVYSENSIVEGNTIEENAYGMFTFAYGNLIYHNNFVGNTYQVYSWGSNTWDNGYPSGGNYWSNHFCVGNPSDGSQPYVIDAYNIDHYPFQDPNGWLKVHNVDTGLDYETIQEAIDAPETLDGHTIQVDAETYYENVTVNKSLKLVGESRVNTIINGNGAEVVIYVTADNVTIKEFTVRNGYKGVYVSGSNQTVIANNTISHNYIGVDVDSSSSDWSSCTIENNTISNNNQTGILVKGDHCWIAKNVISETTGFSNSSGLLLAPYSNHNLVTDNVIQSNLLGIWVASQSNCNTIEANVVSNNSYGIRLDPNASNNTLYYNNIALNTEYGIAIKGCTIENHVCHNYISKNKHGIYLDQASNQKIRSNEISNNNFGIYLSSSNDNVIYRNNFINNSFQVKSARSVNIWDDGFASEGNYWSDYTGKDQNGDGIGDTPYVIDRKNKDNHPLMVPRSPLIGDVDGDWDVDMDDYNLVADHMFEQYPTWDPYWGPRCDIASAYCGLGQPIPDGRVGVVDIMMVGLHYGDTWPPP